MRALEDLQVRDSLGTSGGMVTYDEGLFSSADGLNGCGCGPGHGTPAQVARGVPMLTGEALSLSLFLSFALQTASHPDVAEQ